MPVVTVKSEPSFKYQVARLFGMDADASSLKRARASLEWTPVTPYKPEMASKMPSPIDH
jgi:hypothetical protein